MSAATLRQAERVGMVSMLVVVSALKLIAETALMAIAAQWLLGVVAGRGRDSNIFYKVLGAVTQPFVAMARWLSPGAVLDRHLPLVAFLLLACGWIALTLAKISICLQIGITLCR